MSRTTTDARDDGDDVSAVPAKSTLGGIFYWGVLCAGTWLVVTAIATGVSPFGPALIFISGLLYLTTVRSLLGTPKWFAHVTLLAGFAVLSTY